VSTAMSLLAGYPQRTVHLAYAWATLAVALAVDARLDARACAGAAARVGGALALGAMLAAVQMLPALELSGLGVRAPAELAEEAMFALTSTLTPALMTLRFRAIMGGTLSFGVAALAMIPAALAAPRRRAVAVWAVALTVVTALFALGDFTPAFALYRVLPALAWFRDPSRILALTEFGVAVAAAFGLEAIVGRRDRAPSRVAIALGAIGLATIVWLAGDGWAPTDAWTEIRVRAAVAAGALALAVAGMRVPRAMATTALVGLVLFEASTTPWAGFRRRWNFQRRRTWRRKLRSGHSEGT